VTIIYYLLVKLIKFFLFLFCSIIYVVLATSYKVNKDFQACGSGCTLYIHIFISPQVIDNRQY